VHALYATAGADFFARYDFAGHDSEHRSIVAALWLVGKQGENLSQGQASASRLRRGVIAMTSTILRALTVAFRLLRHYYVLQQDFCSPQRAQVATPARTWVEDLG
jgi:hypothetical protein